jgi:hypothetical protein
MKGRPLCVGTRPLKAAAALSEGWRALRVGTRRARRVRAHRKAAGPFARGPQHQGHTGGQASSHPPTRAGMTVELDDHARPAAIRGCLRGGQGHGEARPALLRCPVGDEGRGCGFSWLEPRRPPRRAARTGLCDADVRARQAPRRGENYGHPAWAGGRPNRRAMRARTTSSCRRFLCACHPGGPSAPGQLAAGRQVGASPHRLLRRAERTRRGSRRARRHSTSRRRGGEALAAEVFAGPDAGGRRPKAGAAVAAARSCISACRPRGPGTGACWCSTQESWAATWGPGQKAGGARRSQARASGPQSTSLPRHQRSARPAREQSGAGVLPQDAYGRQ